MDAKVILLIDDNASDEALTIRALKKSGIPVEVQVARDGEEALALVIAPGALPDLVLLDLNLPRINGFELIERMRASELLRHLPIVVLSSSTKAEDVAAAYRLGCNAYVAKGVDYRKFAEMAKVLVEFWLAHNMIPR